MRAKSRKTPVALAGSLVVTCAGVLLAALVIANPAAAQFRGGGFGRVGGFARPAPGFRAIVRGAKLRPVVLPRRGGNRLANLPRAGRRPPSQGGDSGRHRRIGIGGGEVGVTSASAVATRASGSGGAGGGNSGGMPPHGENRFVANEVIVQFAANTSMRAIGRLARAYNLAELESQNFPLIGASLWRWRVGGRRTVRSVLVALRNQGIVAGAQPNYIFTLENEVAAALEAPGDPAQYVLDKLQARQAQLIATGKNVSVAVIDSQIDAHHPDLGGSIVKSFDALGGAAAAQSHGTEMAGAIAAHGKLLGIAPGVQLLAARAFDAHSNGTSFSVYKSLQWAADNGARIINMSFAGPPDPTMQRLLSAAAAKDIVLVAAAGNGGPQSPPLYPAADAGVIAVAATDADDRLFRMTNRGRYIAVAAPGVDILALAPGDTYALTTGTSVAAAHVSAIAALLLQHDSKLNPADIRSILMASARPVEIAGPHADFDPRRVNAYKAVTWPVETAGSQAVPAQARR